MLSKLYRWIFGGCDHEWKIIKEINKSWRNDEGSSKEWTEWHLQCKKCGNIKKKSMK